MEGFSTPAGGPTGKGFPPLAGLLRRGYYLSMELQARIEGRDWVLFRTDGDYGNAPSEGLYMGRFDSFKGMIRRAYDLTLANESSDVDKLRELRLSQRFFDGALQALDRDVSRWIDALRTTPVGSRVPVLTLGKSRGRRPESENRVGRTREPK